MGAVWPSAVLGSWALWRSPQPPPFRASAKFVSEMKSPVEVPCARLAVGLAGDLDAGSSVSGRLY